MTPNTLRARMANSARTRCQLASDGYTKAIADEAPAQVRQRYIDRWLAADAELYRLEGC